MATELSVSTVLQLNQTFMQLVMKLAASQFKGEIVALAKSNESKFCIMKFSTECIEKLSPIQLQILYNKYTPLLSHIHQNSELSGPPQPKNHNIWPDDQKMGTTITICLIGYAYNFFCNSLQVRELSCSRCQKYHQQLRGIVGYFLYALNTTKQVVEAIH